ncbi:uncharacterized protein LOC130694019 [Daphnia carinata]|uniref:uncharacterized protein LOC130694019 n=1 Tax=Daphnia carinata TaxID=120202 RepID=UPI0025810451|nr:uncharacterized protein LOC130694019 [Daphnia carinata]
MAKKAQRYEIQMQLFEPKSNLPVLTEVPIRPKTGFQYIFKWEDKLKRQEWRSDGFRWRQYSTVTFKYGDVDCKRYYFKVQVGPGNEYTTDFTRHAIESPLYENKILIWYQGDDTLAINAALKDATDLDKHGKAPQRFENQMKLFLPEAGLPILSEVPLRPKGGFRYIFKWEIPLKRQDWRVDGYRWRQNSVTRFTYNDLESKRYYFKLQVGPGEEFSTEFTKNAIECPLHENQVLVWYQGDESVVRDFAHGNSKDPEKEYHRTAPSVLKKIQMETVTEKLPLQVYSDLLTDCSNRARHMIDAPRDVKQIQNARKFIRRAERSLNETPNGTKQIRNTPKMQRKSLNKTERSSHETVDAIYNLYASGAGFVSDLHVAPNILIICFDESTVAEFRQFIKREDLTVQCLTYGSTFIFGEFCLSVLTFRQTEFEDTPVIPLMYVIYEKDTPLVHDTFFMRFATAVPEFETPERIIIISDEDVAITSAIEKNCPGVTRLRCWQHALQSIKSNLQSLNITEKQEVQQYESDFIRLLNQDSAGKYKSLLAQFYLKKWKQEFSDYFDVAIDPDMNRMGAWALRPFGLSLQTAHQPESFSGVMRRLSESGLTWSKSSVDGLVASLMKITDFFNVRVARSRYRLANHAYTLKANLNDFYDENDTDFPDSITVEELMSDIRLSRAESIAKLGKRNSAPITPNNARRYESKQNDTSMQEICILEAEAVQEGGTDSLTIEHVILVDEAELDQDTVMYICH